MKQVVVYLDVGDEDRLLGEEAVRNECGYAGRPEVGADLRVFYISKDGHYKWEFALSDVQVREIADGILIDLEGTQHDLIRTKERKRSGQALMIWGEYGDDALRVRHEREMISALDHLHESSAERPRMLRLWTTADDQLIAMINGDSCALYVVESVDGYATTCGPQERKDSFEVLDHDGRPISVPFTDCIAWERARNALLRFISKGDLGPEIRTEGRIPTALLMMGDVDRKSAIAARAEPPRELSMSSLPRMLTPPPDDFAEEPTSPHGVELEVPLTRDELVGWAGRLVEHLHGRELIELLDKGLNVDEMTYQLVGLLQAHGTEAQESIDTADWLANEIGTAVHGVKKLFATGGDLQIALRRSRGDM